ncbi:hypothetical protein GF327_07325 [Candidatus Woesearchaeota archaeon]|nr:hypothetical protein [Candidatus Woesearchaeota archaeon]
MKKTNKLLVEYEDILLDFSMQMKWLLKRKHKSTAYRMAVWNSIHKKSIERLEKAHEKLLSLDKL